MEKVFVVVSYFSDSNSYESSSKVCLATCKKSSAEKVVSFYEKNFIGSFFEIVETDLFD